MFQTLFTSMNQMLEQIRRAYPSATATEKSEWLEKLETLKWMSDTCLEEWLQFEEHMANVYQQLQETMEMERSSEPVSLEKSTVSAKWDADWKEQYEKGIGYYELSMYDHALEVFSPLVEQNPACMSARLYLAFCYFFNENFEAAAEQFQFIIENVTNKQILALAYYALSCIHIFHHHWEQAEYYFHLARESDPSLIFYSLS